MMEMQCNELFFYNDAQFNQSLRFNAAILQGDSKLSV